MIQSTAWRNGPIRSRRAAPRTGPPELVIITGLSGSGKGSVLKALEDLGYYSVDNLPVELIPKFAELTSDTASIRAAALVVDMREGEGLKRFPASSRASATALKPGWYFSKPTTTPSCAASAKPAVRIRWAPTTRSPRASDPSARQLAPIRAMADLIVNTSKFTVHELREFIEESFRGEREESKIMVYVTSFGYRHGVPADSDLVFDVRFLPNPNYIPEFKNLTGRIPRWRKYIRSFPQTVEFIDRISDLLIYLMPHYIREGKSYLTIAFGCTGGHHRSVMIADAIRKRLAQAGFRVKTTHRDVAKAV